jgi:hypothetical protein
MIFNTLQKLIPFGRRGAALLPSYRVNSFLTKLMTGNKSGALLLTTFVLMLGGKRTIYQMAILDGSWNPPVIRKVV